jgi:hypothetical protein
LFFDVNAIVPGVVTWVVPYCDEIEESVAAEVSAVGEDDQLLQRRARSSHELRAGGVS